MEETIEYLNDTAVMLAKEAMHDEAIACLRKGLLKEPTNATLWFNLSLSLRAQGKIHEAQSALITAAEAYPFDPDVWDTLGLVSHELGDIETAQIAYLNALDIAPENGRIWNNYGVLFFSQEKYLEARQSFEKALTLDPTDNDALFNLHDTYEILNLDTEKEQCAKILKERNIDF